MQRNGEPYVVPELTLIGDAAEVVRGMGGLGIDFRGEILISHFEFEPDQLDGSPDSSHREESE